MKIVKILSTISPPKDKYGNYKGLFVVTIDYGDGNSIKSYMNEYSYEVFKLEQALLKSGVNSELLTKYHDAIQVENDYNHYLD